MKAYRAVLSTEEIAAIDRRERGIPQAHEMARVLDSHEALRAEVARLRGQTCATCQHHNAERPKCNRGIGRPESIVPGLRVDQFTFGCNQWAARDTARPSGGESK